MSAESKKAHNFIQSLIEDAVAKGEHTGKVVTRFHPSRTVTCTSATPNPFA